MRKHGFFSNAKDLRLPVLDGGARRLAASERSEDGTVTPLLAAIVAVENGITVLRYRGANVVGIHSSRTDFSPTATN